MALGPPEVSWLTDLLVLLLSFGVILLAAEYFTNSVEWLGKKLNLSEGAVGSILAAVGTAMPETMVPLIALISGRGSEVSKEIGIGAILGAPFMLGTLALCITGIAAVSYAVNGRSRRVMLVDPVIIERDLRFFLIVYAIAIAAAFIPVHGLKVVVALGLFAAYFVYAYQTVTSGARLGEDEEELRPLYIGRRQADPSLRLVLAQVALALAGIVIGARFFVTSIEHLATLFGVPAFVLALIIAPVATELPEKVNSVIWVRKAKDTLALGNITGAMVFQSSVIPAFGMLLTPWVLNPLALMSAALTLFSVAIVFSTLLRTNHLHPGLLLAGGFYYIVFVSTVLASQSDRWSWYLLTLPIAGALYLLHLRHVGRLRRQESEA